MKLPRKLKKALKVRLCESVKKAGWRPLQVKITDAEKHFRHARRPGVITVGSWSLTGYSLGG
jgi:hypothetical protein